MKRIAILLLMLTATAGAQTVITGKGMDCTGGKNPVCTAKNPQESVIYKGKLIPAAHYRYDGHAALNDLKATPGAVNPKLTKAVICAKDFRTGPYRKVSEKTKHEACAEYGVPAACPDGHFEIDHLISLELGGSDDLANLWPQPADNLPWNEFETDHEIIVPRIIGFHTKDKIENEAHKAVCEGKITLQFAQHAISTDWYKFGVEEGWIK